MVENRSLTNDGSEMSPVMESMEAEEDVVDTRALRDMEVNSSVVGLMSVMQSLVHPERMKA